MLFLFFDFTPLYGHNPKKVCDGGISTNFDMNLEPVDVKMLKKLIFCQQAISAAAFSIEIFHIKEKISALY